MQSPPQNTAHLQGILPLQVYLCLHHGLLLCKICTVKFLQVFSPGVSDLSLLSSSKILFTWLNVIVKNIVIIIYFVKPFTLLTTEIRPTMSLQKPHDRWKMRKMRFKEVKCVFWGHQMSGRRDPELFFRAEPSPFNGEGHLSSLVLTYTLVFSPTSLPRRPNTQSKICFPWI